ncbi:MAG: TetR family transcriptional regulator [Desulfuromonas sp.]|nr:MAG: TetR family transcriptional regulator [Desulfuromonas sp.]
MGNEKTDKRTALMQAALELFAEFGFNGSSTAQIAKRAGVASGTLFFHFNSKDELILELVETIRSKVEKRLAEAFNTDLPVRTRFLQTFSMLLHYALENPQEFKLLELYHFSPYCKRVDGLCDKDNLLRALLIQAKEQGLVKDAPLLFLEAVAFGPITSLAKEHANHDTPISDDIVRMTVEACWDGLKKS